MERLLSQIAYRPIRFEKKRVYYFDKDGVYCSATVEEIKSGKEDRLQGVRQNKNGKYEVTLVSSLFFGREIENSMILKMAGARMQEGESFEKFMSIARNLKIETHELPQGLDRFIGRIASPTFYRVPENFNKRSFDFIYIDVMILTESAMPNREEYIEENKKEILDRAVAKLKSSKEFQDFKVPVTALKISRMTLMRKLSMIQIVFEKK